MILHKNFCAFFQTKNMSFPKKVVGVNHLFWIFKSHQLHLTCFFSNFGEKNLVRKQFWTFIFVLFYFQKLEISQKNGWCKSIILDFLITPFTSDLFF